MNQPDQPNSPENEPNIVVDDDWKSQVEKEKQQIQEEMESSPDAEDQIPEASFQMLVTTLATQSMVSLGIIPDPMTNTPQVNKPVAKHLIDTLSMLEEKTKGNLDQQEAAFLKDTLHQLRMTFVALQNQPPASDDGEKKPTIELP